MTAATESRLQPTTSEGAQIIPGLGLHIADVDILDPAVGAEALHWTTGVRGDPVSQADAEGCDLTHFVREAVALGSRVLAVTSDAVGLSSLNTTVTALAERAETATAGLISKAQSASTNAIEASAKAAAEAREGTAEVVGTALEQFRTESTRVLDTGVKAVTDQLDRLAADAGPVATSIKEVVNRAMSDAQESWHRSLTVTLTRLTRSLDATDPGTPFGQLTRQLEDQQQRQFAEFWAGFERLHETVAEATGAATTAAAVAAIQAASPAKGRPFEEAIGAVVEGIACGIGASYSDTSGDIGEVSGSKKGDGVIELAAADSNADATRVVVEYTTSGAARNWPSYLADAERNRAAQASLGIVPSRDLVPGKEMIAILGPGRMVIAHDVDDDPGLVRAAVQLLVVQAQRRLAEARGGDLGAADRKIAEARQQLVAMQAVLKTALAVRAGANKVVTGLEGLHATMAQLLEQAQDAIRASSPAPADR